MKLYSRTFSEPEFEPRSVWHQSWRRQAQWCSCDSVVTKSRMRRCWESDTTRDIVGVWPITRESWWLRYVAIISQHWLANAHTSISCLKILIFQAPCSSAMKKSGPELDMWRKRSSCIHGDVVNIQENTLSKVFGSTSFDNCIHQCHYHSEWHRSSFLFPETLRLLSSRFLPSPPRLHCPQPLPDFHHLGLASSVYGFYACGHSCGSGHLCLASGA